MPPKKRKLAESNDDELTNEEGSESISQEEDNVQRATIDSLDDTTVQDLPLELLEYILVKTVVIEVMSLKLAQSAWKEKSDLVMNRLRLVCSHWNGILTTKSFRTKLHKILDGTAQTIRLEVLRESPINPEVIAITTLKDEIFMLCEHSAKEYAINVCNRNDMENVTDVILLPGKEPLVMAGCAVSNCVYIVVLKQKKRVITDTVFRILRDVDHKFELSPWIKFDPKLPICTMAVSANGSVMIRTEQDGRDSESDVVNVYRPDGSLEHQIMLPQYITKEVFKYQELIPKSNGNFIFAYINDRNYKQTLVEIDTSGNVVRKYYSFYNEESCVNYVGNLGSILITEPFYEMRLLDSELNLIGIYSMPQDARVSNRFLFHLHYDSERNEIARIHHVKGTQSRVLITFRFTEE